ncbi:MAG: hypothetical protein HN576_00735 [Bacteriovoracaceae bacterium]|jgi:predicted Zn-dependent protease|nr:hypothetical protein [Bacteriovoracaceae bacterium]
MKTINILLNELNLHIRSLNIEGSVTYEHEDTRLVRCGRNQISVNTKQIGGSLVIELLNHKKSLTRKFSGLSFEVLMLKNEILEMSEILPLMPQIDYAKKLDNHSKSEGTIDLKDNKMVEDRSLDMVLFFKSVIDFFDNKYPNHGLELSGAFSLGSYGYNYIDVTMENAISHESSDFSIEVVLQMTTEENKELRSSQTGEDWSHFMPKVLIDHLMFLYTTKLQTERINIPPGKYNIIFSNDAMAELAVHMGYIALNGESLLNKSGMLDEQRHPIGAQIFSPKFTLSDNPTDPEVINKRTLTRTGLTRRAFPLFVNGVLKNIFFSDKSTCDKFNRKVNNHFNSANLKVHAGSGPSNWGEVLKSITEPTIYVSYIHYINFTNPTKGEFTGTSRFGTFLIENGEVKSHLHNLRINDNFFNIFNNIDWLSKNLGHTCLASSYGLRWPFSCTSPLYSKIDGVNISGTSFQE